MSAVDIVIHNSEAWMGSAVCASSDPEEWFPERGASAHKAKKICATCPVINECLQYALDNGEATGIWGGTSGRERERMLGRAS